MELINGMRCPGRAIVIVLLALSWTAGAECRAQDGGAHADGMLDRAQALSVASEITPAAYPDAEEVLVAGMLKVRYEADGTYTQWHEEFVKIMTEDARRRHTVVSSHFTIPYQRGPEDCAVTLLEIVRPDGSAVPVDVAAQSRIMIDPSSMDENIYNPNEKIMRVNVPGLEVGDVLHFVMFDRIVQPRMKDTWADWIVLESTRPVVFQTVEFDAPASNPIRSMALKDEIEGTVVHSREEKGARILYRWEARNVPRMFPEPDMPPLHTVVQRLLVSTAPDWETVSRWYWNLSEPHYQTTPEMEKKVAELTEGVADRRRRIEALFSYVAQEIRYMGITVEATAPGYEPHDVKDTFEAMHGVCRDKAALLVVMLRLAGFDAYPTLIHNGPKKDAEVPQPYFNHAIVAVREAEGEFLLMDPTLETSAELLPAYFNDKSFLVATPAGDGLMTSPVDPADENMMRIATSGSLDRDGNLKARTTFRFDGVNDNAYRGYLARSRPEDRRRLFEGLVKHAAPGARLDTIAFTPEDMLDVSTTLTVRVEFAADEILIGGKELAMMPLPAFGTRVGMVNFLIGRTGLRERKYPLVTDIACGVHETIELDMDETLGAAESMPASPALENPELSWSLGMGCEDGQFRAEADFRLEVVEFSPREYLALKDALSEIELALRKMPVFAVDVSGLESARNDSVVISDIVDYRLTSERSWQEKRQVRRKILTYAGKKRYSELKLGYNAGTEALTLDRAVVTGKEGESHEIRAEEINVMDAAWVGSAPRYPPGRTLVAAFPAVDVGSIVEYEYTRVVTGRQFFAELHAFAGPDEIQHKELRVHVPAGMGMRTLRLNTNGDIAESVNRDDEDGTAVYEWKASDVPAVKLEESLPPWWAFNPTVFVSTVDPRSYCRQLRGALRAAAARQSNAERKARELTRGEKDAWKKIRFIRDFVAVHVREAGPDLHDLPLSAVTPADETLSAGYGNATDRAVLLYAMLRASGFKPEFVAVSSLPAIERFEQDLERAADPRFFARILVRLRDGVPALPEGSSIYLNDTDQYAAVGASSNEGNLILVLKHGRIEELRPALLNRREIRYDMDVTSGGDVDLTIRRLVYGDDFGAENKRFMEMTPEEKRRDFQEMVADVSQAAEARGDLMTDFSGYPGVIEFSSHIPRYAVRDGDFLYFTAPGSFATLLPVRSDTRANPLYLGWRYSGSREVVARIPAGFGVEIQAAEFDKSDVAGVGISVRQTVTEEGSGGRTFVLKTEADLAPAMIDPLRYREILDLDRVLSHKKARTVVLRERK